MKSKPRSPVWPYLAVLACLFLLSLTAPRAWEQMARRGAERKRVAAARAPLQNESAVRRANDGAAELREPEPDDAVHLTSDVHNHQADAAPHEPPLDDPAGDGPTIVPPAPQYAQEVVPAVEGTGKRPASLVDPNAPPPPDDEPSVPVTSGAEVAAARWPEPRLLIEQLDKLRAADPKAIWAADAVKLIRGLCDGNSAARPAKEMFAELRSLAKPPASSNDHALDAQHARARYALARLIDVLESASGCDTARSEGSETTASSQAILKCLADVERQLGKTSEGTAWRQYMMLDMISRAAQPDGTDAQRRAVARRVIDRLAANRLTRSQQQFAAQGALAKLRSQLRAWAAEGIASARLVEDLERYERSGLPSDARAVADDWRGLKFSVPTGTLELGNQVDAHYRNANVRVAASAALVNRMVPQPETISSSIHDRILDLPVCGRSTTFTKVSVRLVPDPNRIRVGLEARGTVASDTVSASGPAKFRNQGQSTFLVRKLVVVNPDGVTTWPAVAQAENNYTNLVALETNFDGMPLVGSFVRSIARSQHDQSQGEAIAEAEQKVAVRARDQFDAQVRPQLVKAVNRVQTRQAAMLKRMGLELVPLDLSTTEDRVVARMRLATNEQLGAHTPRPQAPSDSWLSIQLHQSALNNVLEQLDLAGRKFTLPELFNWVGQKLDKPEWANREDLPEGVQMKFAAKDAVRVRCLEDKLEVTFAFAELTQGSKTWRNFTVRADYRPKPEGRDARLGRDSTIHLSVRGTELLLRTIFSKVLSKNRDVHLLDEKIINDPRLEGLEIKQFVIEEGWIGLAYSPAAGQGKVARKPKK